MTGKREKTLQSILIWSGQSKLAMDEWDEIIIDQTKARWKAGLLREGA